MKPPDIDYNAKGNTRDRIFPRERNSNLSAHTRNFRSFIYYSCETNGIEIYFDAEKDISFGEICNETGEIIKSRQGRIVGGLVTWMGKEWGKVARVDNPPIIPRFLRRKNNNSKASNVVLFGK